MIHELKCEKQFFDDCVEGRKTFEMREKRDRPFAVGDFLALNEVDCTDNEFDIQEIAKNMVVHRSDEGVVFYYTGRCALLYGKPFNPLTMPLGVKYARKYVLVKMTSEAEGQMQMWEDVPAN